MLNASKVWVSESRDALDVAASLLRMMNELIALCHPSNPVPLPFANGDLTTGGSAGWNRAVRSIGPTGFGRARALSCFKEIALDAAELQRVDMLNLLGRSRHGNNSDESSDERSFYLSLLNLLVMHATVSLGIVDVNVIVHKNGVGNKVFKKKLSLFLVLFCIYSPSCIYTKFLFVSFLTRMQVGYNVGGEVLTLNDIKHRMDESAAFSF